MGHSDQTVVSELVQEPEALGRLLREHRKALGVTQARAASLAGVSTRLWSEVETGRRAGVSFDVVIRMLQIVGLDLRIVPRATTVPSLAPPASAKP